ncbi:hypothetical protein H671_5g14102 [Cricetulus griseus]|nr:hypothetical protein H671_5g14102 [Cricetulus griseus]
MNNSTRNIIEKKSLGNDIAIIEYNPKSGILLSKICYIEIFKPFICLDLLPAAKVRHGAIQFNSDPKKYLGMYTEEGKNGYYSSVIQLPGMSLDCQYQHQVHDGDSGETKQEELAFAMTVELLGSREHLHAAINQGSDGEEPHADHGEHQVANVVSTEGEKAQKRAQCSINMDISTDRA